MDYRHMNLILTALREELEAEAAPEPGGEQEPEPSEPDGDEEPMAEVPWCAHC